MGLHAEKQESDVRRLFVLRQQGISLLAEDEFDDDWHVERHIAFEPGYFADAVLTLIAKKS